ncbi:DUF2971 domain-containing protein [Fusibacter ferrireducens]|uniref:DUF2971 domain-containing protein n=1 Tax=Fusibacter ferrireducens TaxID=2785058 RepID=A0ABR9ZM88_9FIRM|nr:DUF2971 domain-containing protein [Fusibacter ferrireducens]MBF4691541.1 DUF2971 domain-containing protein [Fusibacter ferrireducens]
MDKNHEYYVFANLHEALIQLGMEDFSIRLTEADPELSPLGDILMYFKGDLIGLIEVKKSPSTASIVRNQLKKWSQSKYKFKFYGLINDVEMSLFNENLYPMEASFYTFREVLLYIAKLMRHQDHEVSEETELIEEALSRLFHSIFKGLIDDNVLDEIIRGVKIDGEKHEVLFNESIEMQLIDCLLKTPEEGTKIYKYTALESAFLTLNHKQFLMSGIVGMNDTTEVDYVESYLFKISIEDHKKHWRRIEDLNQKFIMSCTALKDDLTMWRLYGDDFKGASFEMEILKPSSRYIIKQVHYAKRNGEDAILEVLKKVYNEILNRWGLKLIFKKIDIWKHFFKPYEYAVEREVRILYTGDETDEKLWNLTYTHQILNPFIFVKMDESLPFKIKKIYLGRKSNAFSTNEYQFQQLIRERGLHKEINVLISDIVNYR